MADNLWLLAISILSSFDVAVPSAKYQNEKVVGPSRLAVDGHQPHAPYHGFSLKNFIFPPAHMLQVQGTNTRILIWVFNIRPQFISYSTSN
jgi:hypothetical protein